MRKVFPIAIATLSLTTAVAAETLDPKADPKAVVTAGNARFTVLTDRLIRMEWSPDGRFEDRATLAFVNRKLPVPAFASAVRDGGCTIDTGKVKLTYAGGEFSPATLTAEGAAFGRWRYGDADRGNLYGTRRTLDKVDDFETLMKPLVSSQTKNGGSIGARMEEGLLSRDGWTVVDDSTNHVFVATSDHWGEWVAARGAAPGARDLYLFAYGHDYRGCLGDFIKVAGRIELPPRWAFGYWWSRYWLYSDSELRELVCKMEEMGIPLDVLMLDMEWHETWGLGDPLTFDEFGQWVGWTGYTWNRHIFPEPRRFISWLHERGLRTAPNLHPASGIQPMESCYRAFCDDYGWKGTNAVPYRMAEPKWADSYFKTVLGPMEDDGVDFWWLDWQQWGEDRIIPGLSVTFWINHAFHRHAAERNGGRERPMIYHRWGGLGSHRYQVGFSGDSKIAWSMLEAIPWFTATASNVGYGYWGHDCGGHHHPENGDGSNPDLFLRWLQSGVFTPILKTHCSKDIEIERRVWMYPDHMDDMKAAIRLRYRLAPYVYTAAREAYDTGVSMCRPMYYDWPEEDAAYDPRAQQYMFGDDILACTMARPADPETRLTDGAWWFPKGTWYDVETGSLVEGGARRNFRRTPAENAWFVRAGAVIPMYPDTVMNVGKADGAKMALFVAPGAEGGSGQLYEDDGVSSDYAKSFARTLFAWSREGTRLALEISPRLGVYAGMPKTREWEVRFPCRMPPVAATVNGRKAKWTYSGSDLQLSVATGAVDPAAKCRVELEFSERDLAAEAKLFGKRGEMRRARGVAQILKRQMRRYSKFSNVPTSFFDYAETGTDLDYDPTAIHALLERYDVARAAFAKEFKRLAPYFEPAAVKKLAAWLGFDWAQ